jgi:hypothetical protein
VFPDSAGSPRNVKARLAQATSSLITHPDAKHAAMACRIRFSDMTYAFDTNSIRIETCTLSFEAGPVQAGAYYVDAHAMKLSDEASPACFVSGYIIQLEAVQANKFTARNFAMPVVGTRHGHRIAPRGTQTSFDCVLYMTALQGQLPSPRSGTSLGKWMQAQTNVCLREVTTEQAIELFSTRGEPVFGRLVSKYNKLLAEPSETSVILYGNHEDEVCCFAAICVMAPDPYIIVTQTLVSEPFWSYLPSFVRVLYGTEDSLIVQFEYFSSRFVNNLPSLYHEIEPDTYRIAGSAVSFE